MQSTGGGGSKFDDGMKLSESSDSEKMPSIMISHRTLNFTIANISDLEVGQTALSSSFHPTAK